MRECVRIRRSDAAETGRGRGGSPRSQREQSAAATRGSSADATRRAEGPSPRADSRAAGRLEGVREGPGRGAAVRGSPEALPGGPSPLPCEATAAPPPLLAALPGAVTLAATRFSWLSLKTETGCAAPSGFCTGRDLCRPWGPQLSAVARGPLAAPRGVFPGPAVGGAAAQDAQALGKPGRPPPAARRRGEHGAERISRTRPMSLAGGIRGVFLPGDLSGPPLCPSRAELTGRERGQRPWPWGLRDTTVPGATPPRAPSRARLPPPQSHPQAPPALARPGLTWSPRGCFGSRSTWP